MVALVWIILLIAMVLAADICWTEYRDWRARRQAVKNGRTLTEKFSLPPS